AREDLLDALELLDTDEPDEEVFGWVPVFFAYAAYARVGKRKKSALQLLRGSSLAESACSEVPQLAAEIENAESNYFSLFTIDEVVPERGVHVRDEIRNRRHFIEEKKFTHDARRGMLLGAWVQGAADRMIFEGSILVVPPLSASTVLALVKHYRSSWRPSSGLGWQVRACRLAPLFLAALARVLHNPPLPQLTTTDGEELVHSRAFFAHTKPEQI